MHPLLCKGQHRHTASAGEMLKLRLLTWDVKDTLLRLRSPVGESYSAEAQAFGLRVEAGALSQSFRRAYEAHSKRFPNYGLDKGLSSRQWWLDVVTETFRLSGVHEERVLLPMAEKLYQDYTQTRNWELLPGARETLGQCQGKGIRMAVVSNFDRRLQEILVRNGLHQHFEFTLSSEDAGCAKPDRRIFLEALRIAGVAPQLAAHVGDHYENDYKAAREVGMHSFLLRTAAEPAEWEMEVPKDHILPSLSCLPSLIEKG
ncbi:haloacid dehalogenase-like hydrolase domain-containing protein 3 [Hemicordylus capensis]|uniref:haloacid dehalogenase-like hydrolase domain-containing protein 3 n=1 Tax=Hemicordylus capensis TaxID=884348 RepID=UPI0023046B3B|nr:haloacid dehalogenase-like hydrolase domain-containing protein 3 [Hemicordylus capensis]